MKDWGGGAEFESTRNWGMFARSGNERLEVIV